MFSQHNYVIHKVVLKKMYTFFEIWTHSEHLKMAFKVHIISCAFGL